MACTVSLEKEPEHQKTGRSKNNDRQN